MADMAVVTFLLIFTRVTALFVLLPFTSYRGIPNLFKAFFALVVAYLLFTSRDITLITESLHFLEIALMLGREVLIGLTIGFVVQLFFTVFRMAGQWADVKIGLSMASLFDPQFGSSVTLLGQFYYLFAIIIYFALHGHHHLFLALAQSLDIVPLGKATMTSMTIELIFTAFYYVFTMSIQIATPIIATILITDISLGLISKTVPQLHVFLVGLPLKVLLGLFVIYLILPHMSPIMNTVFTRLNVDILKIMESFT